MPVLDTVAGQRAMTLQDRSSAARLAAVQVLYQVDFADADWRSVMKEYGTHRLDGAVCPGGISGPVNKRLFRAVVTAVGKHRAEIDRAICARLPEKWPMERLDPVLLATFRAAGAELLDAQQTPVPVVLSEYVLLAEVFGAQAHESAFANAMLEGIATELRPAATDATNDG